MQDCKRVVAVCLSPTHRLSKTPALEIRAVAGLGIEGDAHYGTTTQHRYDRRKAPDRPNLRQVHLVESALLDDLGSRGFDVRFGDLGENIVTAGMSLTALPEGTILRIGAEARLQLTGLREPCVLLDRLRPGLRVAVGQKGQGAKPFLRGGVMSRVLATGFIRPHDEVTIEMPSPPHRPLGNV